LDEAALDHHGLTCERADARCHTTLAQARQQRGAWATTEVVGAQHGITNNSTQIIDTHLLMVARGLPRQIELVNGNGKTQAGDPYLRVFLKDGVIMPGKSITVSLVFKRDRKDPQAIYSLGLLSGQGKQP
jgi:hypothetical protein